jgi:transposase-like protein
MVAVENRGKRSGRVHMSVIPDFKKVTIDKFLARNVAPGSTIYTDGLKTFAALVIWRKRAMTSIPTSWGLAETTVQAEVC